MFHGVETRGCFNNACCCSKRTRAALAQNETRVQPKYYSTSTRQKICWDRTTNVQQLKYGRDKGLKLSTVVSNCG